MSARLPFDPTGPLPAGTVVLEASAGTGKTHTITSLVLRLVAEGRLPLERILVVTFTRPAAAELRGRIRTRLGQAVDAIDAVLAAGPAGTNAAAPGSDDEVVAHLIADGLRRGTDELAARRRALAAARERFDDATIDTIHGFCHRALQQAAPDVDLDLGAELTEDLTELVEEVVGDLLVRTLRTADTDWYRFLVAQGVGRDRLAAALRAVEAEPHLAVLPEPHGTPPRRLWEERLADLAAAWAAEGTDLVTWLVDRAHDKAFDGAVYNRSRPVREAQAIDAWLGGDPIPVGDLRGVDKHLAYVGRARIEQKLRPGWTIPPAFGVVDAADALLRAPADATALVLSQLTIEARAELARRKVDRALLSFADLLVRLDDALRADPVRADAVRAGIRARFDAALIDEFQDTDPVQWRILDTVFGADRQPPGGRPAPRLFLIGDPKQAIYGFRGADVDTYLAAVRSVPDGAVHTLPVNWRSDQRYLDALDALLDRPGTFAADGGVFATAGIGHARVAAAPVNREPRITIDGTPPPALEIHLVPRRLAAPDDGDEPGVLGRGWAWRELPRLVADGVVGLLESGAAITGRDGEQRPTAPRDIGVLVRTNAQARRIQAALHEAGVPAVIGSDRSVLETPEATDVQRLLDALLRPGADRELRRALAGPVLGVTAAELAEPDLATSDVWLDRFERWATLWRGNGIAAVLRSVLATTAAAPRILAGPRGERAMTNLAHLTELLHTVEVRRHLGPEALTAWLREQRHASRPAAEELELRLESDEDAVAVTTIHKAKGLQYPVVWCPFLWDGRLLRGGTAVLRFPDPVTGQRALDLLPDAKQPPKDRHVTLAERDQWQEDLRLMYVALTRAQHRCVIHTGVFAQSGTSALHRLLHGARFVLGDGGRWIAPGDLTGRSDEELLRELEALASPGDGVLAVREVRALPQPRRWQRPDQHPVPLSVRSFDRSLDTTWQRTSFTRLVRTDPVRDEGPDAVGVDHDQLVDPFGPSPATPAAAGASPGSGESAVLPVDLSGPDVPLAGFPRGAAAGTFLHGLLEELDLAAAAADPGVVVATARSRLARTGLAAPGPGTQPGSGIDLDALAAGIQGVLTTPLGRLVGDVTLAEIAPADRRAEVSFDLPVSGGDRADRPPLTLGTLATVLEAHAATSTAPLGALAARLRARPTAPARGFLTGSIDLVVRVGERYLVVDHKSNWLGERQVGPDGTVRWRSVAQHYAPARLRADMVAHDYLLQELLYLVALHRLLRWRLGAGYEPDRHLGGALYLFLRGMVGPDAPRDADGSPTGVHADRPPIALIADLDRLLAGALP